MVFVQGNYRLCGRQLSLWRSLAGLDTYRLSGKSADMMRRSDRGGAAPGIYRGNLNGAEPPMVGSMDREAEDGENFWLRGKGRIIAVMWH